MTATQPGKAAVAESTPSSSGLHTSQENLKPMGHSRGSRDCDKLFCANWTRNDEPRLMRWKKKPVYNNDHINAEKYQFMMITPIS